MTFQHQLLHKPITTFIDTSAGRYYDTPAGKFPSVTTVLSAYQDKKYLTAWRAKIGDEAADAIVKHSRTRGNTIHKMAEKYLLNETDWADSCGTLNLESFREIQPLLDAKIDLVYGCELPLYSNRLKIAGTTDAIVEWAGKTAIVDFKTSKRTVSDTSDKLRFYKMQTTIYAMMVAERYSINPEYSHIIIMIDNHSPKIVSFRNTWFRLIAEELIGKVVLDNPIAF